MKPSVLLISLDTLRADVAYSGGFPTLERLRRAGSCFRSVVSSVPLTPASHATILTGLQPARHGIRHLLRERLDPSVPTLAGILRAAGYATGAIVSCPALDRWYGMNRGFSHYDDEMPRLPDRGLELNDVKLRGTAMKRAPLVTERALSWLAQRPSEPWFLFVHYFDSHWPYEPPETYGVEVANDYEGEVAFMDHHLGELLDGLADRGVRLEDTIVICLSDHGEDLGGWYENDHAGERGHPEEQGHGCLLFDATQQVPLWICWPNRLPRNRQVDVQVRVVDVTPTVLDLLGLPMQSFDGGSLVPLIEGHETSHRLGYCETYFREELVVRSERSANLHPWKALRVANRYKVIWEVGTGTQWWHDLAADPREAGAVELDATAVSDGNPRWGVSLEETALGHLRRSLDAQPALRAAFEELVPWLEAAQGIGLVITGSFARGTADAYSDLDLRVEVAGRPPDRRDACWIYESISSVGRILAFFPAVHLRLPDLWIYFLERDGAILKMDVDLKTAHEVTRRDEELLLRLPATPCSPCAPLASFMTRRFDDEHELRHSQFTGWVWYTYTKIARGELLEALDSLHVMRQLALIPSLQALHDLPREGSRRLEARLGAQDLRRLLETIPASAERRELVRSLEAMIDTFEAVQQSLVEELGRDPRKAELGVIAAAVRAAERTLLGES